LTYLKIFAKLKYMKKAFQQIIAIISIIIPAGAEGFNFV